MVDQGSDDPTVQIIENDDLSMEISDQLAIYDSILNHGDSMKENGPRTVNDVKLINAGKILENSRTLGECRSPMCDVGVGVTTMHVVVRPPSEKGTGNLTSDGVI
ncbi:MYND-type zinc finger protein mub1 [Asimina triloba]